MNPIINTIYDDLLSNTLDLNYWVELEQEAPDFFNRIREEFSSQYKEAETQDTQKAAVREAQKAAVDMINLLTNQLESLNGTAPHKSNTISLYREKLNIHLRYIETYNKPFLDYAMPLSQFNYQSKMNYLLNRMLRVRTKYADHNSDLLALLGNVFQSNVSKTQRMSYGRYQLWTHIVAELEQSNLPSPEGHSFDCDIRNILLRCNFNNQSFCNFYFDKLQLDLEQHQTYAQKLMRLEWHLKQVNQQHSKKYMFYSYTNKKLLAMLKKHISVEIKYYSNLSNLNRNSSPVEIAEADQNYTHKNQPPDKAQLQISANTMSYLLQAFWKEGQIKFKSKSHFGELFSATFEKNNNESISANYISNSLGEISENQRAHLKATLEKILEDLD